MVAGFVILKVPTIFYPSGGVKATKKGDKRFKEYKEFKEFKEYSLINSL